MFSGCGNTTVTTMENGETQKAETNDLVVVPNVIGMNKDEAIKTLEDLGLVVEPKEMCEMEDKFTGEVVDQNAVAGTTMVKGSNIQIKFTTDTCIVDGFDGVHGYTIDYIYPLAKDGVAKIPQKCDGKEINAISYSALATYDRVTNEPKKLKKLFIPESVAIVGEKTADLSFEIVRY